MNKLSKEKKEKLIGVALATVMVCYVLHFFVVSAQKEKLGDINNKIETMKLNVSKAKTFKDAGPVIGRQLAESREVLDKKELGMAPSDKNRWFFNTVIAYMQERGVNYETSTPDPQISEAGLFPKFPYQAATYGVKGTGRFHDVGRFVAEFENKFPTMRLTMLRLQPLGAVRTTGRAAAAETNGDAAAEPGALLVVGMDVMTLVKP